MIFLMCVIIVGYFREGFLSMQNDISKEIIKSYSSAQLPEILMRRFPYPPWIDDPLLTALQSFVSIIFMLSFVYSCINTVKVITTEKEKQLKVSIQAFPSFSIIDVYFFRKL